MIDRSPVCQRAVMVTPGLRQPSRPLKGEAEFREPSRTAWLGAGHAGEADPVLADTRTRPDHHRPPPQPTGRSATASHARTPRSRSGDGTHGRSGLVAGTGPGLGLEEGVEVDAVGEVVDDADEGGEDAFGGDVEDVGSSPAAPTARRSASKAVRSVGDSAMVAARLGTKPKSAVMPSMRARDASGAESLVWIWSFIEDSLSSSSLQWSCRDTGGLPVPTRIRPIGPRHDSLVGKRLGKALAIGCEPWLRTRRRRRQRQGRPAGPVTCCAGGGQLGA